MPFDYVLDDDYYEDDFIDEENDSDEIYFDCSEDMEKYYDFNLLDLLEDIDLDCQDLSKEELKAYLEKKKSLKLA